LFSDSVLWNPSETTKSESIASLDENNIRFWKLTESSTKEIGSSNIGDTRRFTTGTWNPLHPEQITTANDNAIRGWDLRTLKETYSIIGAHNPIIRDLDFNPNKDYYLVTCGDDFKIKFWDTRKLENPIKSIFDGHSHFIWNIKYNRYHDQLLLSSSSDNKVNLWNIISISSSPPDTSINDIININNDIINLSKNHQDHLIKSFQEHEDSVYSISWGVNAWIFATLSYDGRVVINYVPKDYSDLIKY
jgi:WD40 repeat protein